MNDGSTALAPARHGHAGGSASFARRFAGPFAVGLVGIATLPPMVHDPSARAALPQALAGLPPTALVLLSLLNPLLMLAAAAAVGAATAHRVGLRSRLAGLPPGGAGDAAWRALVAAAIAGLGVAVALAAIDAVVAPALGPAWDAYLRERHAAQAGPERLVSGMLYGGLTEEVLTRWGLVSLFAWALAGLGRRLARTPRPVATETGAPPAAAGPTAAALPAWAALAAIVLAAAAFAVGHLPALAAELPLTPQLVARTVGLNAIGGIVYGLLFWRRGLEAAMVAHATTHVGLFAIGLLSGR